MKNIPSIFFIVPTLNSYATLPRLVKSLKNQIFQNWRLLFVDGESNVNHKYWLKDCCNNDSRINYIEQTSDYKGIYGAMNQGLNYAKKSDWILFWGSDDWIFSKKTLSDLVSAISSYNIKEYPDLIVCQGIYIDSLTGKEKRLAKFLETKKNVTKNIYKKAMFFGNTPPHQASIIGPGARKNFPLFNENFSLTADLDFFLSLCQKNSLKVDILKEKIVFMEDSGISSKLFCERISQVLKTYYKHFNIFFLVPFIFRYIIKIRSKKIF